MTQSVVCPSPVRLSRISLRDEYLEFCFGKLGVCRHSLWVFQTVLLEAYTYTGSYVWDI